MKNLTIYFAYEDISFDKFKLQKIVEYLENKQDIQKVYYSRRDINRSITEYMDEGLTNSDIILLYFSRNLKKIKKDSGFLTEVATAIHSFRSKSLPLFIEFEYIPKTLRDNMGVKYDANHFDVFLEELFQRIIKYELEKRGAAKKTNPPEFDLISSKYNAQMRRINENEFVVLKNSIIQKEISDKSYYKDIQELRERLIENDKLEDLNNSYRLLENQVFSSVSAAAYFVQGYRQSGWDAWKLSNKTYREYF